MTVSHLRFGPRPIHSPYLIRRGELRRVPSVPLLERFDVLEVARAGRDLLLEQPVRPREVWDQLPAHVQETDHRQEAALFVIDATRWPRATGMGARSTRSCRRASSRSAACCRATKRSPRSSDRSKTYGKRGEAIVRQNFAAVDRRWHICTKCRAADRTTSGRRASTARAREGAGLRAARHGAHHGRRRRPAAGQRVAGRWALPDGTSRWEKRNSR